MLNGAALLLGHRNSILFAKTCRKVEHGFEIYIYKDTCRTDVCFLEITKCRNTAFVRQLNSLQDCGCVEAGLHVQTKQPEYVTCGLRLRM